MEAVALAVAASEAVASEAADTAAVDTAAVALEVAREDRILVGALALDLDTAAFLVGRAFTAVAVLADFWE